MVFAKHLLNNFRLVKISRSKNLYPVLFHLIFRQQFFAGSDIFVQQQQK